ncbi:MAG: hypothetical protein J5U19_13520, partial [Candidatus Methanoperedens sp.]|nr:hypothetical protein [Candidatus Methanoperedens sp.]
MIIVITMIDKFHQNNKAVSPILGAILILAISITVIANVQLNFVPVWNAKEDLDHLAMMNDDMRNLKSGIEESAIGGTALSNPVSMGFKYSPKVIVYNPKENAWATLKIEKDVWAEIRYNEVLPEGMDDAVSIKNISTSTITYTLHGASELNSFFYEHGLVRHGITNFTQSAQTLVSDGAIYALSVNTSGTENINGIERREVTVYPVSSPRNSVIGKNVWLLLKTGYPQWWADDPNNPGNLKKRGGEIKLVDIENGTVIVHFDSMVIRMGEADISTLAAKSPSRSPPSRLVRITPQNVNLPIEGTSVITVEVQDKYNNPVPNIQVNFNMNNSMEFPANANSTATLLQTSAISGVDGMASVMLRTGGAGYYYVDASLTSPSFNITFAYPASSEGYSLSLSYSGSGPNYPVVAALKNGLGTPGNGTIVFDAGDGLIGLQNNTNLSGIANTLLDTSTASGLSITGIRSGGITDSNVFITWDTVNNITVTARTGNVFNYNVIPT